MDLNNTLLNVAIKDIDQLSPTEFTLARKAAFGGSDTGVLVGVNPYQTLEELLAQKNNKIIKRKRCYKLVIASFIFLNTLPNLSWITISAL